VDYGKLIEATRAQIERKTERSRGEKLHRRFMFELLPGQIACGECACRCSRIKNPDCRLCTRITFAEVVTQEMQAMEGLLPKLGTREAVAEVTPAAGTKRRRVGLLLLGCVRGIFPSSQCGHGARSCRRRAAKSLRRKPQPCCGALLMHAGEEAAAMELAKRTIGRVRTRDIDTIVTNRRRVRLKT